MSIQVKRRREAASFLSTFIGAQGEIIVDTTNNRVQVHDGSTPGGWPAAKLSEVVTNARTAVSDANYAALASDRTIAYTAITATRTVTLPASSAFPTGIRLLVFDESGACSSVNTITVTRAGSDVIDGAASASIKTPYGFLALQSNGAGKWTLTDASSVTGGTIDNVVIGAATAAAASVIAPGLGDSSQRAVTSAWFGQNLPGGFVNKFRNGTMDVWQRGTAPMSVSTAGAYTADGWIVVPTGASCGAQIGAGRSPTNNSLQVYGGSGVTDVLVKQRMESYLAAPLSGQTVTVQGQVYNNTGGAITPTLTVKHAGAADNWSSPVTDVSAVGLQTCANGAWTRLAYTFNASSSAGLGLEVSIDFGNNFTAGARSIQLTELDLRLTPGVAVGQNANPPPPELRPIGFELAFCQRYAESSYDLGTGLGTVTNLNGYAAVVTVPVNPGGYQFFTGCFSVQKRAPPAVTIYSLTTGAAGNISLSGATDYPATIMNSGDRRFNAIQNNSSVTWASGAQVFFHCFISAEL